MYKKQQQILIGEIHKYVHNAKHCNTNDVYEIW